MRVLHIVAEGGGSVGVLAAAESLIASMVAADPGVEVTELELSWWSGAGPAPSAAGPGAVPPSGAALLSELVSADLFVLTAPSTEQVPEGVVWLAGVLRGPQARLARAADRRGGHRVSRRLVVVAGQDPAGPPHGGSLLALVRDAFRVLDVTESGVISGEPGSRSASLPPGGSRRSSARSWAGRRDASRGLAAS